MSKSHISVLAVIVTLVMLGVTMSSVAVAQEAGNATGVSTENATEGDTETPDTATSVTKISSSVTLQDYEFSDSGKVTLWIKAGYTQNMVISDMFVSGSGAQKIPQKRMDLDRGMNKVTFEPTTYKGTRGVVVGTSGGAVGVSEEVGSTATFTSTYEASTLILMGVVGIVTGIVLVLLLAYKRELDYTEDIEQVL